MPSAQDLKGKGKIPKCFPAARSGDVTRVSAKDGESCGEILKAMKAKKPSNFGSGGPLHPKNQEILQVLKLLPWCESRWASQTSGSSAGCTSVLAMRGLRWSV